MNLHNIVSGAVGQVNPPINATLQASTGYTTTADGTRIPTYAEPTNINVQMQALQYNDIQQISSLNIQGLRQAMYINGDWLGLIRADNKGGDIITLPDGSVWIVAMVLERWSVTAGWCKVCVTLQDTPFNT